MKYKNTIYWVDLNRFDKKPDKSTLIEMSKVLGRHGFKVNILTGYGVNKYYNSSSIFNIKYFKSCNRGWIFRISLLLNILTWLVKNGTKDCVYILHPNALFITPVLLLLGRNKVHLDIRTVPVEIHTVKDKVDKFIYWTIPMSLFSRAVKSHSYITESLKNAVVNEFRINEIPYCIWGSGVNTNMFYPVKTDSRSYDQFNLFYHGTVTENRGIMSVVNAIAQLDKKSNRQFRFIIVGDGSGLTHIKEKVERENLSHCIEIKGMLPYELILQEIIAADCCICPLPNRPEWNISSPLKIFEYMACAKPMIVTPIPAHKDILAKQKYVVWSEGDDSNSLINAIEDAYVHRMYLSEQAKAAPELVKKRYTWNYLGNQFSLHLSSYVCLESFNSTAVIESKKTEMI